MNFVTRDPATGLRRNGIRWPDGTPPTPDGCRWCGRTQQEHCQRWTNAARWHGWTAPTDAQRLARMLARRGAR